MNKIVARFSNGFEDEYKGSRAVKAAWMIVRKSDGEVVGSGHSLDRARAAKTADGNLMYLGSALGVDWDSFPKFDVPQRLWAGANYSYLYKSAAEHGYDGPAKIHSYKKWASAKNAERKAAIAAAARIEIVDL
jgi:hypothetical protein